ncbi:MAG TPA: hypothetical protein VN602_02045 [Gemmatimonadaceae bacterium]|nr:hypothetical protein [Gemmatimonadaceae bacterium]
MSAFVSKSGKTPKVYVYDRDGIAHRRTLGTSEYPELAPLVEQFVKQLRRNKRWPVLDAIIARQLTCCEAYRLANAGTLDEHLAQLKEAREAKERDDSDTDLSPLVDVLVEDPKYRKQIRRLIPKGERYPSSKFTRKAIAAFIRDLKTLSRWHEEPTKRSASPGTKNRYRAALSVFAQRLIEEEVIDTNPVQYVKPPRQSKAAKELVFLDQPDTKRLVQSLTGAQRALEALMAGSGIEWGACARLKRADVDLDTRIIYAHGTKNKYRNRYVEVTEDWAWEIFAAYARTVTPHARLFTMTEERALRTHQSACRDLDLKVTTLHQHRHGYAVPWLKAGKDHQRLKNQLGHAPHSTLIYTTYGVYIDAAKLTQEQQQRAGKSPDAQNPPDTNRVTTPRNHFKSEVRKNA